MAGLEEVRGKQGDGRFGQRAGKAKSRSKRLCPVEKVARQKRREALPRLGDYVVKR